MPHSLRRPVQVTVVEDGTRAELTFDRPQLCIGRAIDNDIRLVNTSASRHHCRIEIDPDGIRLQDLGSSNGTQVNGNAIDRYDLGPGDEVQVGSASISVRLDDTQDVSAKLDPVPEAELDALDEGGGQRRSRDLAPMSASTTQTGDPRGERMRLRAFARITRSLVREMELAPLLRLIVDSAVALAGGERGFLLLASNTAGRSGPELDPAAMTVRVARTFDRTDIPVPNSRLSLGVAGRVLELGRPVLTVDAGHDDRFSAMASVEELRLRSILCVPVEIEDRIEGVLYVDNRLQRGVFCEEDLDLVELFAGQSAVAIRNARLMTELKERNQRLAHSRSQIEALNDQLGRKVRDRDSELAVVRAELGRERGRYDYTSIVGSSDGMRRVFEVVDRIIQTELPVLIQGESGTGKELIARAIHFNGGRSDGPFVSLNCAALPDSLLESELFGHTRGAFTGADRTKTGLIEQANGGTLLLDEIGDMTPEMQKKLLRVLQEGEVRPLGANSTKKVDVRLVAASHRDLGAMVKAADFREDLYYRINVLTVALPPLRERREDIPLLAEHLLARAARDTGRALPVLPHEVLAALVDHTWPGNVRELENEMRRLVVLAEDVVQLDQLSPPILAARGPGANEGTLLGAGLDVGGDLRAAVARFEKEAIRMALERTAGNKSRAAAELGISRFALQRKLEKYALAEEEAG